MKRRLSAGLTLRDVAALAASPLRPHTSLNGSKPVKAVVVASVAFARSS